MNAYQPMAARIVNRLHVSASSREVVHACSRALRKKARRDPLYRADRKALYRAALVAHAANRELYDFVMRGSRASGAGGM